MEPHALHESRPDLEEESKRTLRKGWAFRVARSKPVDPDIEKVLEVEVVTEEKGRSQRILHNWGFSLISYVSKEHYHKLVVEKSQEELRKQLVETQSALDKLESKS